MKYIYEMTFALVQIHIQGRSCEAHLQQCVVTLAAKVGWALKAALDPNSQSLIAGFIMESLLCLNPRICGVCLNVGVALNYTLECHCVGGNGIQLGMRYGAAVVRINVRPFLVHVDWLRWQRHLIPFLTIADPAAGPNRPHDSRLQWIGYSMSVACFIYSIMRPLYSMPPCIYIDVDSI